MLSPATIVKARFLSRGIVSLRTLVFGSFLFFFIGVAPAKAFSTENFSRKKCSVLLAGVASTLLLASYVVSVDLVPSAREPASLSPGERAVYLEHYYSEYEPGYCCRNVQNYLKALNKRGVSISDYSVLLIIPIEGKAAPYSQRWTDTYWEPVVLRDDRSGPNTYHWHVVLKKDGNIYDFNSTQYSEPISFDLYFSSMIWSEPENVILGVKRIPAIILAELGEEGGSGYFLANYKTEEYPFIPLSVLVQK